MLTLLAPLAFAAPAELPDDAAVLELVSKAVGKDVPEKFLCKHTPVLPEPFDAPLIVAGIKVKGKGCITKGVISRGRLVPAAEALPVVLGPVWPTLDEKARINVIEFWTREVLFAYVQPQGSPEVSSKGGTLTSTTTMLRRSASPLVAEEAVVTYTFAKDGTSTQSMGDSTWWKSELVLKPNNAKGIEPEQLQLALETKGKLFERCFRAGWQADVTMAERTRMTWTITDSKATAVKARQPPSPQLVQCYANALGQVEFPVDGEADVDLGVRRLQTDAPK